jgi:cysteine desulfurase
MRPGYFDHSATTPMRPEAIEAMAGYLADDFGNPSGAHAMARVARRAIDDAREIVADALGAEPGEVVFTSGGTEADNLAVLGGHDQRGGVVVGSAIEHPAVLDAVTSRQGIVVGVDRWGRIDLQALRTALEGARHVSVVSVMAVNNEIGTIQPLAGVADVVRELAPDAVLHTDAVQAVPWLDVARFGAPADLISMSAHKFGGPKGVGALVVRQHASGAIAPRQRGGGQERERRSGTPDVAGIVAMAEALSITVAERTATVERVARLRDRLADELSARVPDTTETGVSGAAGTADRSGRVAGACHLAFDGVESEALLFLLEADGIYASAGSSCASGAMEPSHVLSAMGVPRSRAFGSVRLSLGHASTDADVDLALEVIPPAVARLREYAP